MGRDSTEIMTTNEALKIELSYLFKNGYIRKGCKIIGSLSWNNDSSIDIETSYDNPAGNYIRLIYSLTDRMGNKNDIDTKILLVEKHSNLGKGKVVYFKCPVSCHRCRILYMCYGSSVFMSRLAYSIRIYYPCQLSTKFDHDNDRYWSLHRKIEHIQNNRRDQETYRGNITHYALRLERLQDLEDKLNRTRLLNPYRHKSLIKKVSG